MVQLGFRERFFSNFQVLQGLGVCKVWRSGFEVHGSERGDGDYAQGRLHGKFNRTA